MHARLLNVYEVDNLKSAFNIDETTSELFSKEGNSGSSRELPAGKPEVEEKDGLDSDTKLPTASKCTG